MQGMETPPTDPAEVMPAPAVMNVRQAAAYLNLSEKRLREILLTGNLRYSRLGEGPQAHYRIRREWLDAFIEMRATGGRSHKRPTGRRPRSTAAGRRPASAAPSS